MSFGTAEYFRSLEQSRKGRLIDDDAGSPYLGRRYLLRLWRRYVPAVFLHKFFRSDSDREHHNHPWRWAVAIVLTGGYVDYRFEHPDRTVTSRRLGPLSINMVRSTTFHRVELLDEKRGCWTIFIAGPQDPGWGFMDPATGTYESHEDREARLRAA